MYLCGDFMQYDPIHVSTVRLLSPVGNLISQAAIFDVIREVLLQSIGQHGYVDLKTEKVL